MTEIEKLQERIAYLEKHIEEQDAEMFQQSRRLDLAVQLLKKLESRFTNLEQGESGGSAPADEKPPHY